MRKHVKIVPIAIATAIIGLLSLQHLWNDKLFRAEQKLIRTKASLLLHEILEKEVRLP